MAQVLQKIFQSVEVPDSAPDRLRVEGLSIDGIQPEGPLALPKAATPPVDSGNAKVMLRTLRFCRGNDVLGVLSGGKRLAQGAEEELKDGAQLLGLGSREEVQNGCTR